MKQLRFISVLMMSAVLMLASCNLFKEEKLDVSTNKGRVELAIKALDKDGKDFMKSLEDGGWVRTKKDNTGYVYKKGDEECYIVYNSSTKVQSVMYRQTFDSSFDDVKKYYREYHNVTTEKYDKLYAGAAEWTNHYSGKKEQKAFTRSTECWAFVNVLDVRDLKYEDFVAERSYKNESKDVMFDCLLEQESMTLDWQVSVSIVITNKIPK